MVNKKLTVLDELTTIVDTDILYVVDDPAVTALSRKISRANLLGSAPFTMPSSTKIFFGTGLNSSIVYDGTDLILTADEVGTGVVKLKQDGFTVAPPALIANDILLIEAKAQTITNKTITLVSNTVSGTKAQFDTAITDDNFAYIGQANIFTQNQTIQSILPRVILEETDQAVDGKKWAFEVSGSSFSIAAWNDAETQNISAIKISRIAGTNTIDQIKFKTGATGTSRLIISDTVLTLGASVDLDMATNAILNAGINLTSNTLAGTKAQFNTALSDDDFAYINQLNVFTQNQEIERTGATPTWTFNRPEVVADDSLIGRFLFEGFNDASNPVTWGEWGILMEDDDAANKQSSMFYAVQKNNVLTTFIHINDGGLGNIELLEPVDFSSKAAINLNLDLLNSILTGTKAEFDTALSDDDFAYIGQANVFTEDQALTALKKLFFDGGGDTYITELSANIISIFASNAESLRVQSSQVTIYDDNGVPTCVCRRDQSGLVAGQGIGEFMANAQNSIGTNTTFGKLIFSIRDITDGSENGEARWEVMTAGSLEPFISLRGDLNRVIIETGIDFSIQPTQKIFLDNFGDTSIRESAANIMTFEVGGTDQVQFIADDIELNAVGKLIFDGFGGGKQTFIQESVDDRLLIVVGGQTMIRMNEGTDDQTTFRTEGTPPDGQILQRHYVLYVDESTETAPVLKVKYKTSSANVRTADIVTMS